jgi:hypothetical protein
MWENRFGATHNQLHRHDREDEPGSGGNITGLSIQAIGCMTRRSVGFVPLRIRPTASAEVLLPCNHAVYYT